jgi:hypothetical protein
MVSLRTQLVSSGSWESPPGERTRLGGECYYHSSFRDEDIENSDLERFIRLPKNMDLARQGNRGCRQRLLKG